MQRRFLVFVYLFTLFFGYAHGRLTVATYNIRSGHDINDAFNPKATANTIKNMNVDIIGIQEVDNGTARANGMDETKMLSQWSALPYYAFGKMIDFEGGAYGISILSKHPIKQTHLLHYSEPSLCNQSYRYTQLGDDPCRGALAAEIQITPNTTIWFITTHFGLTAPSQQTEARELISFLSSLLRSHDTTKPLLIFGGDFNSQPESEPIKHIISNKQVPVDDVWLLCGNRSSSGFTFPSNTPQITIDFLFVHGWPRDIPDIQLENDKFNLNNASTDSESKDCQAEVIDVETSDHRPLRAVLDVQL